MASTGPKTHVILLAVPVFGHVRPVIALASNLIRLGHTATIVTGTSFKAKMEAIKGVEFVPLQGKADADFEQPLAERFPDRPTENTVLYDMEKVFLDPFHDQAKTVSELLDRPDMRERKVVIVQDGSKYGGV